MTQAKNLFTTPCIIFYISSGVNHNPTLYISISILLDKHVKVIIKFCAFYICKKKYMHTI
jgi:hypothetical protein